MRRTRLLLSLAACLLFPAFAWAEKSAATKPLNVLFIVADDLRTEVGCYGSAALTPNIDHLASRGVRFDRAYCQQTVCNPSRSSFLTGKRPDTLRLWTNGTHFREHNPDVLTLPQYFKQQGYVTRDVGKIFHNWHTEVKGDPRSWSAPEFLHYANHNADKPQIDEPLPPNLVDSPLCERRDVPDEAYYDGRVAAEAIRVLNDIKDEPFFLAVGFWKPHAPFNAPAKYWDRYEGITLPALLNPARPTGAPELAFHDGRELRGAPPRQRDFLAPEIAEIRHGYFANTTYMDTQLGKVLEAVEELGLADTTLIVFTGDHGYHLGEHGLWAKTSCFELDARVPLVIARPGETNAGASVTASFAELVDLFPTVVELCGLTRPEGLDGTSLVPALEEPSQTHKKAAFTQHPRPAYYDRTEKGVPDAMGYSVRTARVRYTEWRDWQTGQVVARELYDHAADPAETQNTIDNPADPTALQEATEALHAAFPAGTVPRLP